MPERHIPSALPGLRKHLALSRDTLHKKQSNVNSVCMATNVTNKQEALLDSQAVSDFLQVPIGTLNQWAYLHKGPPYIRVGRHRRYRPEALQAWLEGQTRGGSE